MNNLNDIERNLEDDYIYSKIPKKYSMRKEFRKQAKENILLAFTIISVILGIVLGFILRKYTKLTSNEKRYFGFLGEIFLRMLKFLILPLITSSLICGIASLGSAKTVKVATKAFIYYLTTTFLAALLGLGLVITIRPGVRNQGKNFDSDLIDIFNDRKVNPIDTVLDLIRNLFPDNIIQMGFVQYESKIIPKYKQVLLNSTQANSSNNTSEIDYWYAMPGQRQSINVLGLVMFCLVFGFTISKMDKHGKFILELFEAINEASLKIIGYVMLFSPIGIFSLVCSSILNMNDPSVLFEKISMYALTVLLGLFLHGFIVLPVIYLICTKRNVLVFAKNMIEALLIAFATSSSNATLPSTFRCIEEKNKVPKSISRFVLPVGATINMDGTALYEAIAAIFIAQMNNIHLTLVDYIVTSFTATLASIGAAGVPSAGLVTMVIVLSALNLPQSQISLIYAIDWFLDRFRTMINVWGDSIGTGVVAHLCHKDTQDTDNIQVREDSCTISLSQIEKKEALSFKNRNKIQHCNQGFKLEEHITNETTL